MTKEELLRIYSAYLPYKTKATYNTKKYNYDELTTDLNLYFLNDWNKGECSIKLHLWDMDMLTQPIEYKGEVFVPIQKIYEIQGWEWEEDGALTPMIDFLNIYSDLDLIPFSHAEKLLEWHFNVFNLPDSAYIKKENLKK